MEELLSEIHKIEKYKNLKLLKVVYDTTFCVCYVYFIYPENESLLNDEDKLSLAKICSSILKTNAKIEVKLSKSYLDENVILHKIKEYIEENYSSLKSSSILDNIKIEKSIDNIVISFIVGETVYNHLTGSNFVDKTIKFMNDNFCGSFFIKLNKDKTLDESEKILQERKYLIQEALQNLHKVERYDVYEAEKFIGDDISPNPEYIKNIKEEKNSVILAGTISNLIKKQYLPRRNKNKGSEEMYNYYTFKLCDVDSRCSAIYFANKSTGPKFDQISEGTQVLCVGDYKKNKSGEFCYHIKELSFCILPSKEKLAEEKEESNSSKNLNLDEYTVVFPREYVQFKQDNLFASKKQYPENIVNNTYVVFDTETTGLSSQDNEITEIGAVKIENGRITTIFQTLVKPNEPIPAEITKITGITDEMVKDSPKIEDAIKDFYVFCKNCILVGHNIEFDYQFIQNAAKKVGLSFSNERLDTLLIARSKLFLSNYKLGTIVNYLNLELTNAHRALFDATATAEVFLELSLLKNKST